MDKFQRDIMINCICYQKELSQEQLEIFSRQMYHEFIHSQYTLTYPLVRLAKLAETSNNSDTVTKFSRDVLLKAQIQQYTVNLDFHG